MIEEYLDGPEVSLFAITDGRTVRALQPAQDFKRVGDGDSGPNTGGMGAYTPLPWAPDDLVQQVTADVLQPTVDELARRGTPFVGLLYAGLALTSRGVRVVEFNARFGDPETQPLLTRLTTPLGGLLYAAATGNLAGSAGAGVGLRCCGRGGAGRRELSRYAGHRRSDQRVGPGAVHRCGGRAGGHAPETPPAGWSAPAGECSRWWAPEMISSRLAVRRTRGSA